MGNALNPRDLGFIKDIRQRLTNGEWVITSPYGQRRSPITGTAEFHNGVDLAPVGTATRWLTIGKPDAAIPLYNALCGLGLAVWFGTHYFAFCHLRIIALTERGWVVEVGSTGASTGEHLHLVWAINSQQGALGSGTLQDPAKLLK